MSITYSEINHSCFKAVIYELHVAPIDNTVLSIVLI